MMNKNLTLIESLNTVGFKEDQLANLKTKIKVALVPHVVDSFFFLKDLVALIKESVKSFGLEPTYGLLDKYSIDDFFVRAELESFLASLKATGFNEDQLARLRVKIEAELLDQPMDCDSFSERFCVLQIASNSLGVEAVNALLEEFELNALLDRSPLDWLLESFKGAGFVEDQLARLRVKIEAEFHGQPLGNDSFLESLKVLVKNAASFLGAEVAGALLEECKFADLLQRSQLTDYCVKRLLVFPAPADFGEACREMIAVIDKNKKDILKTGLLPRSFLNSSLLATCFARFYDTKITSDLLPADAIFSREYVATKNTYTFMRETVEPDDCSLDNLTIYKPCSFEDATLIPRLNPVHERSLHNVRPKVINLVLEALALFEDTSNKGLSINDLVAKFGSLIVSNLSREEFVELIKVDDALGQTMVRPSSGSDDKLYVDWHHTSSLRGCGLLTNLINLLVYFVELNSVDSFLADPSNVRVVETLRSVSKTLASDANYFSAIAGHLDMAVLNNFLAGVSDLVKEGVQWRGDTIGSLNKGFRENGFSAFSFPRGVSPFTPMGPEDQSKRTVSGETQNIFRQVQAGKSVYWEVNFNGLKVDHLKHSVGFIYIRTLLENPTKAYSVSDLDALRNSVSSVSSEKEKEVIVDFFSPDNDEKTRGSTHTKKHGFPHDELNKIIKYKEGIEKRLNESGLLEKQKADLEGAVRLANTSIAEIKRDSNAKYTENKNKNDRVTNGINRAKEVLMDEMPSFGAHLNLIVDSSDGGFVYMPDRPSNWETNTIIISKPLQGLASPNRIKQ